MNQGFIYRKTHPQKIKRDRSWEYSNSSNSTLSTPSRNNKNNFFSLKNNENGINQYIRSIQSNNNFFSKKNTSNYINTEGNFGTPKKNNTNLKKSILQIYLLIKK